MNIGEVLSARHEGVVIDRPRNTLIQVSQPARVSRITRTLLTFGLCLLAGSIVNWLFDGWLAAIAVLIACALIYFPLYGTPVARTRYTSWEYPEDYNLFEDETIRDRFATHRDEFTLID